MSSSQQPRARLVLWPQLHWGQSPGDPTQPLFAQAALIQWTMQVGEGCSVHRGGDAFPASSSYSPCAGLIGSLSTNLTSPLSDVSSLRR